MAQAALTGKDIAIGFGVACVVHGVLGVALALAPAAEKQTEAPTDDKQGCSSVVSPSCIGATRLKAAPKALPKAADAAVTEERRCPEPLRRGFRREAEPAPPVAVDLLQAQLVAALGVETGKPAPVATKAEPKPQPKWTDALLNDSRLNTLLSEGDGGQSKKKKLGDILGTATGQKDGEGKVNMPGSAYVREVRLAVQSRFVLPPSVPPWERAGLVARVRITRMTLTGQVLSFSVEKKSGNEGFDETVQSLMLGYKSGMRLLPVPPPHILEEVNSRGMLIELRGGH